MSSIRERFHPLLTVAEMPDWQRLDEEIKMHHTLVVHCIACEKPLLLTRARFGESTCDEACERAYKKACEVAARLEGRSWSAELKAWRALNRYDVVKAIS